MWYNQTNRAVIKYFAAVSVHFLIKDPQTIFNSKMIRFEDPWPNKINISSSSFIILSSLNASIFSRPNSSLKYGKWSQSVRLLFMKLQVCAIFSFLFDTEFSKLNFRFFPWRSNLSPYHMAHMRHIICRIWYACTYDITHLWNQLWYKKMHMQATELVFFSLISGIHGLFS